MKHTILLGALLVMALLVSACGPAAVTQSPGQPATESPATSSPEATEPSAATASPAVAATNTGSAAGATASPVVAATSTGAATSDASVPVTGQVEVRAAANFDYGPILVNGDGMPLYIYDQDTQNGTTSACIDEACTANWTPVTTEGTAIAGPGAIQSLLGTITRQDGTTQVAYNGWPLYTYNSDTSAESPAGQGAEPGWTLISPAGKAIPAQ